MSALMRGEWKEINREVEHTLLAYPRDDSAIPHIQWMYARAIRELRRQLAEAQKVIADRAALDAIGSEGPQTSDEQPYAEKV